MCTEKVLINHPEEMPMRITQEADYALRIVTSLARSGTVCGAAELAESEGVPPRFAHKILRKLMQGGMIKSHPGAKGGYSLNILPEQLTMLDVIELIEGPFALSKCADEDYICSKNGDCKKGCIYHQIFCRVSSEIAEKMQQLSIADIIDSHLSQEEKLKKI